MMMPGPALTPVLTFTPPLIFLTMCSEPSIFLVIGT